MMTTMVNATALPLMSVSLPLIPVQSLFAGGCVAPLYQPAEQVGDGSQDRDDRYPHELVPVEEGEPHVHRGEVVVERHPERADQRGGEQDRDNDPDADAPSRGAVLRHHGLFHASMIGRGPHLAGLRAGQDVTYVRDDVDRASNGQSSATVCRR